MDVRCWEKNRVALERGEIKAGNFIKIDATDVTELQPLVGNRYEVSSATTTDIYFNAPIGDFSYGTGSSTEYIEFSGNFSVGGGFIHMPAPPWGIYFQRRLWCPYYYEPAGTGTSPTFMRRICSMPPDGRI